MYVIRKTAPVRVQQKLHSRKKICYNPYKMLKIASLLKKVNCTEFQSIGHNPIQNDFNKVPILLYVKSLNVLQKVIESEYFI